MKARSRPSPATTRQSTARPSPQLRSRPPRPPVRPEVPPTPCQSPRPGQSPPRPAGPSASSLPRGRPGQKSASPGLQRRWPNAGVADGPSGPVRSPPPRRPRPAPAARPRGPPAEPGTCRKGRAAASGKGETDGGPPRGRRGHPTAKAPHPAAAHSAGRAAGEKRSPSAAGPAPQPGARSAQEPVRRAWVFKSPLVDRPLF
jgi:translation initiation factor IF-2